VPEEERFELFVATRRLLSDAGYEGYEVSNFARGRARRSQHNQKYWSHAPYLGLGPSAHSFDGVSRWWNEPKLGDWLDSLESGGLAVAGCERLRPEEARAEMVMLALRTSDGLDLAEYERRFQLSFLHDRASAVEQIVAEGLATLGGGRLVPTTEGLARADHLARCLL
jgi:oxygen-independent coproporphyrinogen-3 oxidase